MLITKISDRNNDKNASAVFCVTSIVLTFFILLKIQT